MAADQNVFFDAKVTVFKLHDGSQLRDLSAYIKESRGLPGQYKVNDVTTYGSTGERPGPSIFVSHFSVEFLFNQITSIGVHTVLSTIFTAQALRAFEYYPAGATTGNPKFSGSAYMPVYEVTSVVGDVVTVHAEFQVDNAITVGVA
jgi:hypothetical protein